MNVGARLNKSKGGKFQKTQNHDVKCVGRKIAGCVTTRYYKGISANNDNLVIVVKRK